MELSQRPNVAARKLADFKPLSQPNMDEVNITEAIKAFTEGVKDPLNPTLCAQGISSCLMVCRGTGTYIDIIRTEYPQLFAACANIVCTVRPHDAELDAKYSICKCPISTDPVIAKLHNFKLATPPESTQWGMNATIVFAYSHMILQNCLSRVRWGKLYKEEYNAAKAAKMNVVQPWPWTVRDVVPRGGAATIETLIEWMDIITYTNFVCSVGNYLNICPSLVADSIFASEVLPTRIYECAKAVVERWKPIIKPMPYYRRGTIRRITTIPDLDAREFQIHMEHFALFFRIFLSRVTESQLYKFSRVHGKDLILVLSDLIPMIESPVLDQTTFDELDFAIDVFVRYATVTGILLGLHKSPIFGVDDRIARRLTIHKQSRSGTRDSFEVVDTMMRSISISRRCHLEGCTESFEKAGRGFDKCGGCKVARYCSKAHQQQAWTEEPERHKEICKKLRQLTGGKDFQIALDEGISKICAEKKVSEAVARDVVEYYHVHWGLIKW